MVGTIRPVVYRDRRLLHWGVAASLHVLGTVMGGLVTGLTLGLVGHWLLPSGGGKEPLLLGVLGMLSLGYGLDELRLLCLPHPQRTTQVPASWRGRFHPFTTAFLYGVGLGTGVTTRIATGVLYVVLGGILLTADPFFGAVIFGLFGLARGASVLVIGWRMRHLDTPEETHQFVQRLASQRWHVHLVAGLALVTCSGYWIVNLLLYLN